MKETKTRPVNIETEGAEQPRRRTRPLLLTPEWCPECGGAFLSAFPLRGCTEHAKVPKICG